MKKLKVGALVFGLIGLIMVAFYFIKQPSYTIKTEGTLYIVNKVSKSVTVFDLLQGKKIKEIAIEIEPHEATSLTNPNRVLVTNYGTAAVGGKTITVINANTNTIEKTISLDGSISPHGIIALRQPDKVAVVTDVSNRLSVVNVKTGRVEKQLATQQQLSHLLVQHPFKPLIYIANIASGSVTCIDIELDAVVKIIPVAKRVEGIDVTPDGTEIWVTDIQDDFISVINTTTYATVARIKTGKEPLRLKFSMDGNYCLVSNSKEGTVSVYDTKTKKELTKISIPGNKNAIEKVLYHTPRPVGILMHPNGLYAFVSNFTAGRVEVIDLRTFTIVSSIKVGSMPDGLTLIK